MLGGLGQNRQAHNLKVAGSNPAPATKISPPDQLLRPLLAGFSMYPLPFPHSTRNSLAFSKATRGSGVRSHPFTDPPWHMQGTWNRGSVPLTFGSRPTGGSPPRPGNQDRRADRPDCGSPPKTNPFWDELFPAEQARIVWLLVERVDITGVGAMVWLRTDGLASLVQDLRVRTPEVRKAA